MLRFNAAWPDKTFPRPESAADLTKTYWRIETPMGETVPRLPNVLEAHLILRQDAPGHVATVGCNRLVGRYERADDALTLGADASTRMACPRRSRPFICGSWSTGAQHHRYARRRPQAPASQA